jgi:AraC-like DNA-binding protein
LERRFLAETGISLGRWRQHQGLLRALEHLAVGGTTKSATAVAGYASPSAFVAAFRKFFRTTPARYFEQS